MLFEVCGFESGKAACLSDFFGQNSAARVQERRRAWLARRKGPSVRKEMRPRGVWWVVGKMLRLPVWSLIG
jgi:hypothetical protein